MAVQYQQIPNAGTIVSRLGVALKSRARTRPLGCSPPPRVARLSRGEEKGGRHALAGSRRPPGIDGSPSCGRRAVGFTVVRDFPVCAGSRGSVGEAAYGGMHSDLSAGLRITSAVAAIVYCLAALVVLRRGGYHVPLISTRVIRVATWMLAGLMSLGALVSFASSGDWERFGGVRSRSFWESCASWSRGRSEDPVRRA